MTITAAPRPISCAQRVWLRVLRVPNPEQLARLDDLAVAELYARKGHRRIVDELIYAEFERRDRAEKARRKAEARRERAEARKRERREEYDMYVQAAWLKAEADCRGELLSKAGDEAGVDPITLWSGPVQRARKLASEELCEWWDTHGRWTYTEWQRRSRQQAAA